MEIGESKNIAKGIVSIESAYLGNLKVYPKNPPEHIIRIYIENNDELTFYLDTYLTGNEEIYVDWGDGTTPTIHINEYGNIYHRYTKYGEYIVSVKGNYSQFNIYNRTSTQYREILSWGHAYITSIDKAYTNCKNLTSVASDNANCLIGVLTANEVFMNCVNLKTIGKILYDNPKLSSVQGLCTNCDNLISFNTESFERSVNIVDFRNAFSKCYQLTSRTPIGSDGIELWERVNHPELGYNTLGHTYRTYGCYNGATNISNFANIPKNWIDG